MLESSAISQLKLDLLQTHNQTKSSAVGKPIGPLEGDFSTSPDWRSNRRSNCSSANNFAVCKYCE